MPTPTLHPVSTHSYDVLSNVDDLIRLLDGLFVPLGGPRAGDHYRLRWQHDGEAGRTLLILFDGAPARLAVMGPRLDAIDRLAVEEVVE